MCNDAKEEKKTRQNSYDIANKRYSSVDADRKQGKECGCKCSKAVCVDCSREDEKRRSYRRAKKHGTYMVLLMNQVNRMQK
jgi:hypothetical protein